MPSTAKRETPWPALVTLLGNAAAADQLPWECAQIAALQNQESAALIDPAVFSLLPNNLYDAEINRIDI